MNGIMMSKVYSIAALIFLLLFLISCTMTSRNDERSGTRRTYMERTVLTSNNNRSASIRRIPKSRQIKKLSATELFKLYNSAVFMVFTSDGNNVYQGSGFFIDDNGLAVSNYHVFKGTGIGAECIKLVDSNIVYKISDVIQSSETEDFILFRVNCNNTNFIPIAKSKPDVGEKVFAIGSPRGLENTFSSGEVSQWRKENLMQINTLIDHGSSGGALINEYGEVVGITSGTFYDGSQANLNYAWSIDVIKPYMHK